MRQRLAALLKTLRARYARSDDRGAAPLSGPRSSRMMQSLASMQVLWRTFTTPAMRRLAIVVLLLNGISSALFLLIPLVVGMLVTAITAHSKEQLTFLLGAFLTLAIAFPFVQFFTFLVNEKMWQIATFHIHRTLHTQFMRKPLSAHITEGEHLNFESLARGKEYAQQLQQILIYGVPDILLSLLLALGFLLALHPISGVIGIAGTTLALVSGIILNHRVSRQYRPIDDAINEQFAAQVESWNKVVALKSAGKEREASATLLRKFRIALADDFSFWKRVLGWYAARDGINGITMLCATIVLAYQAWYGSASAGLFVPVISWLISLRFTVNRAIQTERSLMRILPPVKRMVEELEEKASDKADIERKGSTPPPPPPYEITFQNVSFRYRASGTLEEGLPTLSHVSFRIQPGETVALIGKSGAGKSTVLQLLLKAFEPTAGSITVNGIPLSRIHTIRWRQSIGYIPQDTVILDGTLRDNLLFLLPDTLKAAITDEALERVVRQFGGSLLARLTHGLDTRVGRSGILLSGGERQRVSIMRAVLKQPAFFLIDEATSSLDALTEHEIQQALFQLFHAKGGAGALIITHRLATVLNADTFIILRHPSELQEGEPQVEAIVHSHQEALRVSPTYRTLAQLQGLLSQEPTIS